MHWKGGGGTPPSPPLSRARSLCPPTVSLTPIASLNGICNRQYRPQPLGQPPPTACLTACLTASGAASQCIPGGGYLRFFLKEPKGPVLT